MLWGSFTSKDLGHNPGISTAAMCAMCRTFQIRAALRPTQALRRVGLAVAAPGAGRARRGVGGQGTHHLCQKFGQQLAFRPHIFCVGRWRAIPGLGQRWQPLTESCSSLLSVHLSLEQGLTSTIHGSRGVPYRCIPHGRGTAGEAETQVYFTFTLFPVPNLLNYLINLKLVVQVL